MLDKQGQRNNHVVSLFRAILRLRLIVAGPELLMDDWTSVT